MTVPHVIDDEYQARVRRAVHLAADELINRAFADQRLLTGIFDVKVVCNDGDRDEKGDVEATYTTYSAEVMDYSSKTADFDFNIEEITRRVEEDTGKEGAELRQVSFDTLT